MSTLSQYVLNFSINFLTAFVIVRCIYYPQRRSQKFVLTFLGFNTIIFILLNFLASIELSMGVGLVCSPSSPSCATAPIRCPPAR